MLCYKYSGIFSNCPIAISSFKNDLSKKSILFHLQSKIAILNLSYFRTVKVFISNLLRLSCRRLRLRIDFSPLLLIWFSSLAWADCRVQNRISETNPELTILAQMPKKQISSDFIVKSTKVRNLKRYFCNFMSKYFNLKSRQKIVVYAVVAPQFHVFYNFYFKIKKNYIR